MDDGQSFAHSITDPYSVILLVFFGIIQCVCAYEKGSHEKIYLILEICGTCKENPHQAKGGRIGTY